MFLNAQFGVEIRPGFPRIRGDVPQRLMEIAHG